MAISAIQKHYIKQTLYNNIDRAYRSHPDVVAMHHERHEEPSTAMLKIITYQGGTYCDDRQENGARR